MDAKRPLLGKQRARGIVSNVSENEGGALKKPLSSIASVAQIYRSQGGGIRNHSLLYIRGYFYEYVRRGGLSTLSKVVRYCFLGAHINYW